LHDLETHQEREEQFVDFEKRSANIFVEELGELLDVELLSCLFVLKSVFFTLLGLLGSLQGSHVNSPVEVKRVLIHWVYVLEFSNYEKQSGHSHSYLVELFFDGVDVLHG